MNPVLRIQTKKTCKHLGNLFGIFFEDINNAADGGIYGELVQNRSFEFDPVDNPEFNAMTAWDVVQRKGSACTCPGMRGV